jgi:hypothetical protein
MAYIPSQQDLLSLQPISSNANEMSTLNQKGAFRTL